MGWLHCVCVVDCDTPFLPCFPLHLLMVYNICLVKETMGPNQKDNESRVGGNKTQHFQNSNHKSSFFWHGPSHLIIFRPNVPHFQPQRAAPPARLLLPNLVDLDLPFIFDAENPLMSPLLSASPLLENRFLPPKPNFWSRFWRLWAGLPPADRSPLPRSRPDRSLSGPASTAMLWKRSLSPSVSLTLPSS